jgi:hypothetical protein
MATRDRVIHVPPDAYDRLEREAGRRGVQPDALATELLVAELGPASSDLDGMEVERLEERHGRWALVGRARHSRGCDRRVRRASLRDSTDAQATAQLDGPRRR